MGKGGYHGGSTIIRVFPKLSGRKGPKKGAVESWVDDAREAAIPMPEGVRLKPIGDTMLDNKARKKKKYQGLKKRKKKQKANAARVDRKLNDQKMATRKPNEPLPEYADLVKALREKYSK